MEELSSQQLSASAFNRKLSVAGEAHLERDCDAATRKQRERVTGVGGKGRSGRCGGEAGDALCVEEVVEAEAQLRFSEVRNVMDVVVQEEIGKSKGIDRNHLAGGDAGVAGHGSVC